MQSPWQQSLKALCTLQGRFVALHSFFFTLLCSASTFQQGIKQLPRMARFSLVLQQEWHVQNPNSPIKIWELGPPVLPLPLPVSSPAHTADAASQSSPLHLFLSGVLSLCLQLLKSLLPPFSFLYLLSNLQAMNLSPGIRAALPSPSWDTSTTTRGYESRGAL